MVVDETHEHPSQENPNGQPELVTHDIYTLANVVTVLRLMLVPFFFAVLINGKSDVLAFALFAIAASTDWLDGQIARRTGTVSALGKAIDPLVDRLLIAAAVVGLWMIDRVPAWIVVFLVLRDVYLAYGLWRLETRYHRLTAVNYTGKITTALLLIGFADLILGWPIVPGLTIVNSPALPGWGDAPAILGIWFVYAGVVFSFAAAAQYTVEFRKIAAENRLASVGG